MYKHQSIDCVQEKTNTSPDVNQIAKLYITTESKNQMKPSWENTPDCKDTSVYMTPTPIVLKRNVNFTIPNVSDVWQVPLVERKLKKDVYYSKRDIMR
jgi:hypothetical protein